MHGSKQGNTRERFNMADFPKEDVQEIKISDGLSLAHYPGIHQGKTSGMDKGLFLCWRGRICAGESAGIGLPVWKTGLRTFFPAPSPLKRIGATALQKDFRIDRVLRWRIRGKKAPFWVSLISEYLVGGYMKRPDQQKKLLKARDKVFSSLLISSSMEFGGLKGYCRVIYEAIPEGLLVHADSRGIGGAGKLIVLNEIDGKAFTRFRTGRRLLEGPEIPSWERVSFNTVIESPSLHLAFSISPGSREDPADYDVFCGHELGFGLDWAGLALQNRNPAFTYTVRFNALSL